VDIVLAIPRRVLTVAHQLLMSTVEAIEAVPRIAEAMNELREALKNVERLATFAAEELPEIVYQLEAIRGQLTALEQRLAGWVEPDRANSGPLTPESPQNALSPESPQNG
jgi:prefoldin subunit 5